MSTESEPTKKCNRCGEVKAVSEFPKNAKCSLGVVGTCRACTRERDASRVSAVDAAGQTKVCSSCSVDKPLSEYYAHSGGRFGVMHCCKECHNAARRNDRAASRTEPEIAPDGRDCNVCGEWKPFSEFYKSKGGRWGYHSNCKVCERLRTKAWGDANPDRKRENLKSWREANPEAAREATMRWHENNPEKKLEYARKRRATPKGRLENSIRWRLWNELQPGAKRGRKTFDLLGYTADDLKAHIEARFEPGMSWENYAHDTWHIDHIIPLASFDYSTPDDPEFKMAWALENLQPLWAEDNHSKGPRFGHPSQEGLSLAA